ncbi:hypothetical protein MPTK2_3g14530 [Marchantia polymorpha subsp. ruderalis]
MSFHTNLDKEMADLSDPEDSDDPITPALQEIEVVPALQTFFYTEESRFPSTSKRRKHEAEEASPSEVRSTDEPSASSPRANAAPFLLHRLPSPEPVEEEGAEAFFRIKILNEDLDIHDNYRQLDFIGSGTFGAIYEVEDARNPQIRLAMKCQSKKPPGFLAAANPDEELLRIYKELVIMSRIIPKHKNIIEVKDVLISPDNVYIVQELCASLTLDDFYPVADNASGRRIFKQLVGALNFIHEYGVVHGDLKSDNVLFADRNFMECKIIDFGLSVYRPEWAKKTNKNFERGKWLSEAELRTPRDLHASHTEDIEALGRILHSILAGTDVPSIFQSFMSNSDNKYKPRMDIFDESALNLLGIIGPTYFHLDEYANYQSLEEILQHPWLVEETQTLATRDSELAREIPLLETDLTGLKILFRDWQVVYFRIIRNDEDVGIHYRVLDSFQRGDGNTEIFECVNADIETTSNTKHAMIVLSRNGQPESMSPNDAVSEALRIYNELLITLRILPRHPNIAEIRDVIVHKDFVLVIRELCERDTLEDFFPLARNENSRNIFRQIAEAVRLMHLFGVVHMDLHCHQIVFTDSHFTTCKIVGFSNALYDSELAQCAHENFKAEDWITPELQIMARDIKVEVDIRALGSILLAMMVGIWQPDPDNLDPTLLPRLGVFDENATNLLSKIGPSPFGPLEDDRLPSIDEICLHPWLFF